jgi:hypothetical protein
MLLVRRGWSVFCLTKHLIKRAASAEDRRRRLTAKAISAPTWTSLTSWDHLRAIQQKILSVDDIDVKMQVLYSFVLQFGD